MTASKIALGFRVFSSLFIDSLFNIGANLEVTFKEVVTSKFPLFPYRGYVYRSIHENWEICHVLQYIHEGVNVNGGTTDK